MKRTIDKKMIHFGIVLFFCICASIIFYYILFHTQDLSKANKHVISILLPIIDGFILAYLLNPIMVFYETRLMIPVCVKLKLKITYKKKRFIRYMSLFLTMVSFLLMLYGLLMLIIPQVISSIESIINRFPSYLNHINRLVDDLMISYPEFAEYSDQYWNDIQDWFMKQVLPGLQSSISKLSTSLIGSVFTILKWVFNFIIGIIISCYLLSSKELFCAQAKKIAYALLKEERANNLINNMRFSNHTFGGFISGKLLDSFIIGILCFIGSNFLKLPYAVLISVIVGVTNIIPFFGPYLGAIPCAFIIIMISPIKCLVFLIFILVLQQFDGNILGPKILGDSTGLSSFWVIFAITVFGGILGVLGMFIGVPLFAIIYAAVRTLINGLLEKKDLPVSTTFYMSEDYHSETSEHNEGQRFRFMKKTFENIVVEKSMTMPEQKDTVISGNQSYETEKNRKND